MSWPSARLEQLFLISVQVGMSFFFQAPTGQSRGFCLLQDISHGLALCPVTHPLGPLCSLSSVPATLTSLSSALHLLFPLPIMLLFERRAGLLRCHCSTASLVLCGQLLLRCLPVWFNVVSLPCVSARPSLEYEFSWGRERVLLILFTTLSCGAWLKWLLLREQFLSEGPQY